MAIPTIEEHYVANRQKLVKRMSFRAGSPENGEDVVQEAYERALRYYRSFDGSNFDRWLSTILNNVLKEFKNNEKGYSTVEYDEEEAEGVDCTNYSGHVMAQVYQRIERQKPIPREILMLHFHQEYTATDISRITDYSYAQVHQTILRFRNELKEDYRD
jgi:RNA polymerase sigma factor (sigma-70 family)